MHNKKNAKEEEKKRHAKKTGIETRTDSSKEENVKKRAADFFVLNQAQLRTVM